MLLGLSMEVGLMERPYKEIIEKDGKKFGLLILDRAKISPYNEGSDLTPEERKEIVEALKNSIKQQGLQQMMVATSKGEVFIGGSRLEALKELGVKEVWVEIRDGTPDQLILWSITENLFRKPVESRFLEEGKRFKQWLELTGKTKRDLARQLGVSENYVGDKVRIYEHLIEETNAEPGSVSQLDFKKAREIARTWTWTTEEEREKLINQTLENDWDFNKLRRVIQTTRAAKELLATTTDEIREKLEDEFEDKFFSEELKLAEVEMRLSEEETGEVPLKKIKVAGSWFSTEEAATNFAIKCGGRLLGKVVEEYWVMEVNPVKFRELKESVTNSD